MEPVPWNREREREERKKGREREKDRGERGASVISRVPGSCVRAPGLMNSVGSRWWTMRGGWDELEASPLSLRSLFN